MSSFVEDYRSKINRSGLLLLAAHVPVCAVLAFWQGTGVLFALVAGALLLVGPVALFATGRSRLSTSISMAVSSMGFSALIIHLGHGMIEMHFHIFAVLALLTVFGSVWPVLAAAATIALHHVSFWIWLPASVFNYNAGFEIVGIHAFFVIFETAPACFIARQFERSIRNQAITREQLDGAAERVNEAALTMAEQAQQLAVQAAEQAATLEETSASSLEVSTSAERMAGTTRTAVKVMDEADSRVSKANQVLANLGASMAEMSSASEKIEKIIRTINDIAFQTNILALNAAVEAARAGAAGQGFAVVADEVRSLAQRSANAARETAEIIGVSVSTARASSTNMSEILGAMSEVIESTTSVRQLINGIYASGQEQLNGLTQISKALVRLEQITQLTAANAEQNASVGVSLQKDALDLSTVVRVLGESSA